MKGQLKIVVKTFGILGGGALLGMLLLGLVFCLTTNEKNMLLSYDIIGKEGWYPAVPIVSASLDTYFHSNLPGVLDGGSDSIMLKTALEYAEENAWRAAMDMNGYDYYWHGYVVLLRPLLMFFDYGQIRVLNDILQFIIVLILFLQIYHKKGIIYAFLVPTTYFLLMSLAMPFSLQYSWVFYIATLATIVLTKSRWMGSCSGIKLNWFFMIIGMNTCFFDLLTYPLFTWGFPLLWLLLYKEEGRKVIEYIKTVVCTGLWWVLGYGGMWFLKWCIGSLLLGRNIFQKALYEVGFRLGAKDAENVGLLDRFEVLYINWKHYEYIIYFLIIAVWLVAIVWWMLQKGICRNTKIPAYALVGFSSIVWYLVLANHTSVHHFFTYRIYTIAILATLLLLLSGIDFQNSEEDRNINQKSVIKKTLVVWSLSLLLGGCLSLTAREDITITNGDKAYNEVVLRENEVAKMRFTPSFSRIKEFGICAQTKNMHGKCLIRVVDGEEEICSESIPLSAYEEQTYATIPVSWKLKSGKDYVMEISFVGAREVTSLLVSENLEQGISEYGEMSINDNLMEGQILSSLCYSYRPLSKLTIVFLTLTWCAVLFSLFLVLRELKKSTKVEFF